MDTMQMSDRQTGVRDQKARGCRVLSLSPWRPVMPITLWSLPSPRAESGSTHLERTGWGEGPCGGHRRPDASPAGNHVSVLMSTPPMCTTQLLPVAVTILRPPRTLSAGLTAVATSASEGESSQSAQAGLHWHTHLLGSLSLAQPRAPQLSPQLPPPPAAP